MTLLDRLDRHSAYIEERDKKADDFGEEVHDSESGQKFHARFRILEDGSVSQGESYASDK
jgi:hypothetical protein